MRKGTSSTSLMLSPEPDQRDAAQSPALYVEDRELIFSKNGVGCLQGHTSLRGYLALHSRSGSGVTLSWTPISVLRGLHTNNPDVDKSILVQLHNISTLVYRKYPHTHPLCSSNATTDGEGDVEELVLVGVDGKQYPGFRFPTGGVSSFFDAVSNYFTVQERGEAVTASGAVDHTFRLSAHARNLSPTGHRSLPGLSPRYILSRLFGGGSGGGASSTGTTPSPLPLYDVGEGGDAGSGAGGVAASSGPSTLRPDGTRSGSVLPPPRSPEEALARFVHRLERRRLRQVLVAWRLDTYRSRKRRADVAVLFQRRSCRYADCFDDGAGPALDTNGKGDHGAADGAEQGSDSRPGSVESAYVNGVRASGTYGDDPNEEREGGLAFADGAPPRQLTADVWAEVTDPTDGHVVLPDTFMRAVAGGIAPSLRQDAWKLLLRQYDFKQTVSERRARDLQVQTAYDALKMEWKLAALSDEATDAERLAIFLEHCNTIDQDVSRSDFHDDESGEFGRDLRSVLRTYVFHNLDRGYCQGMLDLLEPLLFVLENEASAHFCFCNLMERTGPRFDRDADHGVERYLSKLRSLVAYEDDDLYRKIVRLDSDHFFFAYRWFLLDFKREFAKEAVLHLWESIWAIEHLVTEHFVVFVALEHVRCNRANVMKCRNSTDMMRVFNAIARDCDAHNPAEVVRNALMVVARVRRELVRKQSLPEAS
eukprot:m.70081 g.70081  ORF g.70081 m.70081 type:complete len:706 (+) comp8624_c0_seq1:77-2194(+)